MLPVIALVGRTNVGKSTLFNRLTRSRDALVADYPGLTRDRQYGHSRFGTRNFLLVDSGGFEPQMKTGIAAAMAQQTRAAIVEADAVIFMVDGRAGLTPHDRDVSDFLRQHGRGVPVIVAVNKTEGMVDHPLVHEFHALGWEGLQPCSAEHGQGIEALLDGLLQRLPAPPAPTQAAEMGIHLAVVGRPNVGKSTLVNTLLGEERVIAFDAPGTTRDAIHIPFQYQGQAYTLIDTAGLRRRGKVFEAVEKFSVIKTLQAIRDAHVVILVLDASQDISEQDAHIASHILEAGRAVVVAVNKWDASDADARAQHKVDIERKLNFLSFARTHFIVAKLGQGVKALMDSVTEAYTAANAHLPTPQLTRLLQEAVLKQAPRRQGVIQPKLRYAHQGGHNPPLVVIHGSATTHIDKSYRRYLENTFRRHFNLVGTPLKVELRSRANPYSRTA